MKSLGLLFLSFFLSFCIYAQDFQLQEGDLIFQESCNGTLGEAIKDVTFGTGGYNFTHVGIVIKLNSDLFILEAKRPKVCITPLQDYLYPENDKGCYPKSVVGRLKSEYRDLIPNALTEGLKHLNKEYDEEFDINNDKFYCSELLYDIFYKANNNKPVFKLNIMTFKSKDTGQFSPAWVSHFSKLGINIPEGKLGVNPGAMSRSDVIDIIYT